jgi:phage terminase small subunit
MKRTDQFNTRQKKFIQYYAGNAKEAALKAGFSEKTGNQLMQRDDIKRAIQQYSQVEISKGILSKQERQQFWTQVTLDNQENMLFRLKASELLAKSQGDFMDVTANVQGNLQINIIMPKGV